ncbi:MAG: lysoplasmalogenase [Flavobacteriaceae bacterium]
MKPYGFLVAIFISGILALFFDFTENQWGFYITKPTTTFIILLYALHYRKKELKNYNLRICLGLFFCLVGDTLLLFDTYFIFGLVSFLIGHLCFLVAFYGQQGFKWPKSIGLLLILTAMTILYLCFPNLGVLKIPVFAYVGVIVLMSWQGIALQQNNLRSNFRRVGWAVGLFMFSDSLLALNKFYLSIPFSGLLILSTYWTSVFLFAQSISISDINLKKVR